MMYSNNDTAKYTTVANEEVKMVRDFQTSCMDEAGRNARGFKDGNFTSLVKQITAVKDAKGLMALYGNFTLLGISMGPFDFGVGVDDLDPNKNVPGFSQGGLGLPSRDYYGVGKKDNKRFKMIRAAYVKFMAMLFKMAGVKGDPAKVLEFETQLAKMMWDKVKMRDPKATYNPTNIANFTKSHLAFAHYMKPIQAAFPAFKKGTKLVLSPGVFFKSVEELLAQTKIDILKAYTLRQFLSKMMPALTTQAGELNFKFYGQILSGVKKRPPLWKRCVGATTKATWGMGDRMFVEKKFTKEARKVVNEMLDMITRAFSERLNKNKWMDEATVAKAKKKLGAMGRKVGYPDNWRSYIGLSVGKNFFVNFLSHLKVEGKRNLDKMGKPVDKNEWGMNPSMVNAYYSPNHNEMAFPAGILQPPFFSIDQPAVLNFGTIGVVMGHELTHGFDDQGAQYDAAGKMKTWWTKKSMMNFKNKTACIVGQYSKMKVPELAKVAPELKINGKLTLGENIADNGGVINSLHAYKAWQKAKDTPTEYQVGGKTTSAEKLFWLAYGQTWCSLSDPKAIMVRIRSDPHSPSRARVEGPVQNTKEFSDVMKCKKGTKMNPEKKCVIW
jgi:predicted metalloendopeptidase